MSDNLPAAPDTSFQFFVAEDGKTKISVRFEGESVWLIQNILEEKELAPEATIRSFRIVQLETLERATCKKSLQVGGKILAKEQNNA